VFGVALNLVKGLNKMEKGISKWHVVLNDPDLKLVDKMESYQILSALNYFLAQDLKLYLSKKHKRAAIFLDTYEALFSDVSQEGDLYVDDWIRDLVLQMPGVLWVICGREFIRWEEINSEWTLPVMEQHIVGELSDYDSTRFLAQCWILEPDIQNAIIKASKGVPLFLDLSVDHYENIKKEKQPQVADFGTTHEAIIQSFISHLSLADAELLKILSVSRFWDRGIFEEVIRHFNIPYPLTRFEEFCSYSFNSRADSGNWQMHELMQQPLREKSSDSLFKEISKFYFDLFNRRLIQSLVDNNFHEGVNWYIETLFHGFQIDIIDRDWLYTNTELFMHRGYWSSLESTLVESYTKAKQHNRVDLEMLIKYYLAWSQQEKGNLVLANQMFSELDLSTLYPYRNNILFRKALTIKEAGGYDQAAAIYQDIYNDKSLIENKKLYLLIGAQYADLQYVQGNFKGAVNLLQNLVSTESDELKKEDAELLRILGHIYRMNELRSVALEYYFKSRVLFESSDDVFGLARIETNLSETLSLIDPHEAISRGGKAIEMNMSLGSMLEAGKAHNAVAMSYLVLGDMKMAKINCNRAEELQNLVGYQSGIGMALITQMYIFASENDIEKSMLSAERAIDIFSTIHAYPLFVYLSALFMKYIGASKPEFVNFQREALPRLHWLDSKTASVRRFQNMFKKIVHKRL